MKTTHRFRRRAAHRGASVVALATAVIIPGVTVGDVIADFNAVAARTATPTGASYQAVTPEERRTLSFVDLATVHLAMYDAVVAIEGGYEPYAVVPTSPAAGSSSAAAAAAAACTVLQGLFPSRSAQYATDCAPYQAGAGADPATARGITLGIEVGQKMLVERAAGGREGTPDYVSGGGIGDFVPAPNGNPIWHFAPYMRAFTLGSPAQFRAGGPPALASASYAEAFEEVRQLGRVGAAALSQELQDAACFDADNPNLFWPRASRVFMNQPSLLENARFLRTRSCPRWRRCANWSMPLATMPRSRGSAASRSASTNSWAKSWLFTSRATSRCSSPSTCAPGRPGWRPTAAACARCCTT